MASLPVFEEAESICCTAKMTNQMSAGHGKLKKREQTQFRIRFGLLSTPQPLTQTLMSSKHHLHLRAFIEIHREAGISLSPWLPTARQLSVSSVTPLRVSSSKTNKCAWVGGRKPPGQQQDFNVQVTLKMQRDKFATQQAKTYADQHPPPYIPP